MKFVDGGNDEYGKFLVIRYDDGHEEKIYITGPKKSNKVENLREVHPEWFN